MIAWLRGPIVDRDATGVVIACQGVGYRVDVDQRTLAKLCMDAGAAVTLFVHTRVAEDALELFGFLDVYERRIFRALVRVNGVGARLALGILSEVSPPELVAAVHREDRSVFGPVTGVGPKKAARLLLELKDRFDADGENGNIWPLFAQNPQGQDHLSKSEDTKRTLELREALTSLGFDGDNVAQTARKVVADNPDTVDAGALLRQALQALVPSASSVESKAGAAHG